MDGILKNLSDFMKKLQARTRRAKECGACRLHCLRMVAGTVTLLEAREWVWIPSMRNPPRFVCHLIKPTTVVVFFRTALPVFFRAVAKIGTDVFPGGTAVVNFNTGVLIFRTAVVNFNTRVLIFRTAVMNFNTRVLIFRTRVT